MTEINRKQLKDLLLKEQRDGLSPAERRQLDEWYDSFDLRDRHLPIFRNAEHEVRVKQRLFNLIMKSGFPVEAPLTKAGNRRHRFRWLSAAAVLVMMIGAAFYWHMQKHDTRTEWLTAQTGSGRIKQIRLEDGSEIWLNAGSKLRYPAHFGTDKREVYLEGEAYFDITHDASRPFAVKTDYLTTHVLGTAFSVTAYKTLPVRTVTVTRGKVQVTHHNQVLGLLTPDKRIQFDIRNSKSSLSATDGNAAISWKDGRLQFIDQDMQDIAGRLDRWYAYSFNFQNTNIKNCRYTASFNSRIPLRNLLTVMKAISLVDYRIDTTKKTVTFLGSGCNE